MLPGDHGVITVVGCGGGLFEARTYVRDSDGRRRQVRRSGKSREAARLALQQHLKVRRDPIAEQIVTDKTTLAELFEAWISGKVREGDIAPQTEESYRKVWRTHGVKQLGALRIRELPTSRADAHLKAMAAATQAKHLRIVLKGMFDLAVRFDVAATNPITGARGNKIAKGEVRAARAEEFARMRQAVADYATTPIRGPQRGQYLPAFLELALATGARPGEVLAIRWRDVDLLADPPTVTINGTIIDHSSIPGIVTHRQQHRKQEQAPVTVLLPSRGVEVLAELFALADPDDLAAQDVDPEHPRDLVFRNRRGGAISPNNLRRSMREALPADLLELFKGHVLHVFRKTTGTAVRDAHGVEAAQHQLGHSRLATTERHYVEKVTTGPDARAALDKFMGGGK